MSLCIRTISCKLPTSRKQLTHLDRRLQNVQHVKFNKAGSYALKACKTVASNYQNRYLDDRLSTTKIQSLKDRSLRLPSEKCNFNQRNGYRVLDIRKDLDSFLFSTQFNAELKNKESENQTVEKLFDDGQEPMKFKNPESSREGRPSLAQIEKIKNVLSDNLPRFFVQMMDYSIYTPDMIFVNNVRGATSYGFMNYYCQCSMLKIYGHIKFIYVKFHVLKITSNPEDDSVKVRWRINGISNWKLFSRFFAFKNPFKVKETIQKEQSMWYDGFSTFYINKDGKVYKHVVDKVMPNSEEIGVKKDLKIPVKLAL